MTRIFNKKRLMFVKSDDLYFLTYNALILLDVLECHSVVKQFHDFRKLAFLIEFVADNKLIAILKKYTEPKKKINVIDKEYLINAYSTGLVRTNQLMRLIFFLDKKNILNVNRSSRRKSLSISINKEVLDGNIFFDKEIFRNEYDNSLSLKKNIRSLRMLSLDTVKMKLFVELGVQIWGI